MTSQSFPAEPVLFLQSTEVLGRHWLPPFSGLSAGPGSVVFSCVGFMRVGVFAMAPNMKVALRFALASVLVPSLAIAQEGGPNLVNNGGFESRSPEVKTWDQLDQA
jgi:hypothetical protein